MNAIFMYFRKPSVRISGMYFVTLFMWFKKLLNLTFNSDNLVMASSDINNRLYNIPVDESIDIIIVNLLISH